MNIYGQAIPESKRSANARVVEMVLRREVVETPIEKGA
jgi:hypothetical protein